MKKIAFLVASLFAFIFSGCANSFGGSSYAVVEYGTVVGVQNEKVGGGVLPTVAGAAVGGLAGAAIGQGLGKDLAIAGGAALGGYVGHELGSSAGQQLKIRLDNGETIDTTYKVSKDNPYMFRNGDRVRVELNGGSVESITRAN